MEPENATPGLSWHIKHGTPLIAIRGDSEIACREVVALLHEAGKSFFVVDTSRMVSAGDLDTFFRLNGITETPDVLILNRFNSIDGPATYFVKPLLLDEQARGRHAAFGKMKQVIITCDKVGVRMDDVLTSCINSVIDL